MKKTLCSDIREFLDADINRSYSKHATNLLDEIQKHPLSRSTGDYSNPRDVLIVNPATSEDLLDFFSTYREEIMSSAPCNVSCVGSHNVSEGVPVEFTLSAPKDPWTTTLTHNVGQISPKRKASRAPRGLRDARSSPIENDTRWRMHREGGGDYRAENVGLQLGNLLGGSGNLEPRSLTVWGLGSRVKSRV